MFGYVHDPLPGHEQLDGFLSIPYLRRLPLGRLTVVSLRFRCIRPNCEHQGHGKFMTLPGDRPRLFNTVDLSVPSRVVVIAEGEPDTLASSFAGVPTVGIPGASNWKKWWRDPLLGYERVIIPADGDDAGRRFGSEMARHLPNAEVIQFPAGHDINSWIQAEGRESYLERIKCSDITSASTPSPTASPAS